MNPEVESCARNNFPWTKVPPNIKQVLGNSQKEYEKCVVSFSIKNQLRHKGNLIRQIKKDERKYYEDLLAYSRDHLMLYPYHLSDVIVKGLRVTPFQYYVSIIEKIMEQEKSYDSLPNFTAADCLRLLGIGRNQYIELMNQCRAGRRLFRRKAIRDLLPQKPASVTIEPWYMVQIGYVTEDDIKVVTEAEKEVIDKIIDNGAQKSGDLSYDQVHALYSKGLVYVDVPVDDGDYIVVPPLEGFVMNRVLGDYFETLLYKIFVSIDEHTSVAELAHILQIDSTLVRHAVSLYCRLGFAHKKGMEVDFSELHPSWSNSYTATKGIVGPRTPTGPPEDPMLIELNAVLNESCQTPSEETSSGVDDTDLVLLANQPHGKRIAFLFDSTLTAFLMMGNLSSGLKNHAVTMFEVGKLSEEALDSLLVELEKISPDDSEGEAQRYFEHALTLRTTIMFLRHNKEMAAEGEEKDSSQCLGLDLIRCESLQSLDPATCTRLLNKNYTLLVSMAPLSKEIRPIRSCFPPHLGPAIPEVNSIWFKLFLYHVTGQGPPSLLLTKGTRLKRLPHILRGFDRLLVTTWSHDPGIIPTSSVVTSLNDALCHSAVLVQAYGVCGEAETFVIPFPFDEKFDLMECKGKLDWLHHPAVTELVKHVDLTHNCGFITMVNLSRRRGGPYDLNRAPWRRLFSLPEGVEEAFVSSQGTSTPSSSDSPLLLPTNGIKEGGAAILEEELNQLDSDWKAPCGNQGRRGVKLTLDLVQDNGEDESKWTFLDCQFGIPLFDADVNKSVSQRIISGGLWKKKSLQTLIQSSRKLCLKLLDFISEFQDLPVAVEDNIGSKKSSPSEVPHPTRNLIFHAGKLEEWNGKWM